MTPRPDVGKTGITPVASLDEIREMPLLLGPEQVARILNSSSTDMARREVNAHFRGCRLPGGKFRVNKVALLKLLGLES